MRKMFVFGISAAGLLAVASAADAATFNVLKTGTSDLLGTFEAPSSGGALTAALLSVKGGIFDVLDTGIMAPVFDPALPDVHGAASSMGAVSNSAEFDTTDVSSNAIHCGVGECIFTFLDKFDSNPPEWHLDYFSGGSSAALAFGRYDIEAASVPLPASAALMLSGLLAGGIAARRRR